MRGFISCTAIAVLVAGCQGAPKEPTVWVRTDGQMMVGNPELQNQFIVDKTVCAGEVAKVVGVAPPIYYRGVGGFVAAAAVNAERNDTFTQVGIGCMAGRGYMLSNASQAASMSAQFRQAKGKTQ